MLSAFQSLVFPGELYTVGSSRFSLIPHNTHRWFHLPVPCSPPTFWTRGWTSMGKSAACCASWDPRWWWSTPPKKRRSPPSLTWPTSWETQVGRGGTNWIPDESLWTHSPMLPTRFHCVRCVRCGKQPGPYLCRGATVWPEECAGLHPDLLSDWLPLCVLC